MSERSEALASETPIRVVLADDQPLVRGGFAVFVNAAEDMSVVGEAADGAQAVEVARSEGADVVVMDIRMPNVDGLAATRRLTAELPDVRVLILTTFEVDEYVFEALRSGASGFLGKNAEPAELIDAIRLVHRGDQLLSANATRALIGRFLRSPDHMTGAGDLSVLTSREREVVALVAVGMSNDDIARHLVVSPHTAKTHVNRAMAKLGARDRAQLVIAAYESGLVRPAAQ
jgi:DNA-binding NarL/FixJ family response regulator